MCVAISFKPRSTATGHLDSFYHDVVLDTQAAKDATPEILRKYAIPHALSEDLQTLLTKR